MLPTQFLYRSSSHYTFENLVTSSRLLFKSLRSNRGSYLNSLHEKMPSVIKLKKIIYYEYNRILEELTMIHNNFHQISEAITALEGRLPLSVSMTIIEL
uniref:Uncharacterized protein n=1 Tax=Lepeophtheirus salmonis TaxID=72036 RepID=A0A0K2TIB1_LEPSM